MTKPPDSPTLHRADWYDDPLGRFEQRYFDGHQWTANVAVGGQRLIDPMGVLAGPATAHARVAHPPGEGLALGSFITGAVALGIGWIPFVFVLGAIAGVVALGLGIAARRKLRRRVSPPATGDRSAMATIGIGLGAVALPISVFGGWLTLEVIDDFGDLLEVEPATVAVTSCERVGSSVVMEGELTNDGDRTARFRVLTQVVEPETRRRLGRDSYVTEHVEAAESTPFYGRFKVPVGEFECVVDEVVAPGFVIDDTD